MRISKNRSGKRVAEFGTREYTKVLNHPKTVSHQYVFQLIKSGKLPDGVISVKLGESRTSPRIIESTRLQDINYVLNGNKKINQK